MTARYCLFFSRALFLYCRKIKVTYDKFCSHSLSHSLSLFVVYIDKNIMTTGIYLLTM